MIAVVTSGSYLGSVYDEYIASEVWASRRARYWRSHERRCAACGSGLRVALHHLVYVDPLDGSEPDSDLLPLCEVHHGAVHGLHAARADLLTLREATAEYLSGFDVELDPGEGRDAPLHHDQWAFDVSVVCRTCQAAAGEACVRVVHGRRVAIRQVHKARKAAAKRAA